LPSVGNGAEAWGQSGHFLTVNRKIGKWENQIKLKNMDSNFISIRPAAFFSIFSHNADDWNWKGRD
jgi:hypothetical protein